MMLLPALFCGAIRQIDKTPAHTRRILLFMFTNTEKSWEHFATNTNDENGKLQTHSPKGRRIFARNEIEFISGLSTKVQHDLYCKDLIFIIKSIRHRDVITFDVLYVLGSAWLLHAWQIYIRELEKGSKGSESLKVELQFWKEFLLIAQTFSEGFKRLAHLEVNNELHLTRNFCLTALIALMTAFTLSPFKQLLKHFRATPHFSQHHY